MLERVSICHITTVHDAFDTRIFYKECTSLAKHFSECFLIAPLAHNTETDGIKILGVPSSPSRFKRFFITDFRTFKKALGIDVQIYHFHDPEFIPWALLLKSIKKVKIIYDVHEDYYYTIKEKEWIKGKWLRKVIASLFRHFEIVSSRHLDAIILADDCYNESFKGVNKRIVEILNYPIIKNRPAEINFEKASFSMVYSGTVSENRGLWNLLYVMKHLAKIRNDIKLYIIGKFVSNDLLATAQDYIAKENLSACIEIVGGDSYIKREVIDSYHMKMDLGLFLPPPSKNYERKLSTKFFEYMLAGIPFIASNLKRWKAFVEENRCGFTVDPNNTEEICKQIIYLIEHPDIRKRMGEAGKKAVLEKYNWKTEEMKLVALYKELLLQ